MVTDNITGLMWKQCSEGLADTSCNTGTLLSYTWKEALDLSEALNNNLGFAGYNDWRVPNITELRSIAVINCSNPAINETVFPNTPSSWFWSSSPNVNSNRTWTVDFVSGIGNSDTRDDNGHVRLVRSGH